jgi:hypothetical protein
MRKLIFLFISAGFTLLLNAQVPKTLNVTAGGLTSVLTATELSTVTNLTLTGTIDASDFKTMRDKMPLLAVVDLSGVKIVEYTGTEGTYITNSYTYSANTVPDCSFYNFGQKNTSLITMILPSSITRIGNSAFYDCSGLTSINIPPSVTFIGNFAFRYCTGISSINLPVSVNTIGSCAFDNCSGLTSINIPSSVTSIENNTFSMCSGLTSVTIPSSVTSIGDQAFYNCSGLTSLNIPSSVMIIKNNAFYNCTKVSSIYSNSPIPINLNSSTNIFFNINKTTTFLYVPSGSKPAYQAAYQWKDFVNIAEMQGLYLSGNSIGIGANTRTSKLSIASSSDWTAVSDQEWLTLSPASGTIGLSSLTLTATVIPNSTKRTARITVTATGAEPQIFTVTQYGKIEVTAGNLKNILSGQLSTITNLTLTGSIDARDFKTMRDNMPLLSVIDLSEATIVEYSGIEGTYYNPRIDTNPVTFPANTVPFSSFYNSNFLEGKTSLTAIILPSSATSIGGSSFHGCTGLTSINIPSSVTTIGSSAFSNCSGLTSINIPSSVTTIGSSVFSNCNGLTSINIPSSVTTIESTAFSNCNGVTSINIPSSVTSIKSYAFMNCSGSFMVDPNNPNYSSLDGVLFNKTQSTIVQCPTSKSGAYIIPTSVTSIGSSSFGYCNGLTSISIPSSVISIGSEAFSDCSGLTNVSIPSSVISIGSNAFYRCNGLTSINIPLSVTTIASSAFENCSSLTSINIPSSVTTIERNAFAYCSGLTSINIPSSVTSIGSYAFSDCIKVSSIYANSPLPIYLDTYSSIFYNIDKTTTVLHVPSGSKNDYQAANQWKDFMNIVDNSQPVANAGPDQSVNEGTLVILNGGLSSDPDNDVLTYKWTAPKGIMLSSITESKPTFIAPEVSANTEYTFSLVINDGKVDSPPAAVKITILNVIKVGILTNDSPAFKFYPNPTTRVITIEIPKIQGVRSKVSVSNLTGNIVFRKEIINAAKFQIDFSDQKDGIYLLNIKSENREYINKIVLKK